MDINYKDLYCEISIENNNNKKQYELQIKEYENKIKELEDKLKKYTSPNRNKRFYEKHKEELIKKNKEYREKTGYKKIQPPKKN